MSLWVLSELLEVGQRYSSPMPACARVHELLAEAVKQQNGVPSISPDDIFSSIKAPFQSTRQLIHSICLAAAAFFGLFLLIFIVDVLLPRQQL